MRTEVREVVNHSLHLAVVGVDGEVLLDEVMKLGVEVEGTCLVVAEELLLNGKLDMASGVTMLVDGRLEVDDEGAEKPREDDTVHPPPTGESGGNNIRGDVVVQIIAFQC
jgi:hypothetical protein